MDFYDYAHEGDCYPLNKLYGLYERNLLNNKFFGTVLFFLVSMTIASPEIEKAEQLFKKVGISIDRERDSFGIKPILQIADTIGEAILKKYEAVIIDEAKSEEAIVYIGHEYKKVFHFYLVHLFDLYEIKASFETIIKIDDLIEEHFKKTMQLYIEYKVQRRDSLIQELAKLNF